MCLAKNLMQGIVPKDRSRSYMRFIKTVIQDLAEKSHQISYQLSRKIHYTRSYKIPLRKIIYIKIYKNYLFYIYYFHCIHKDVFDESRNYRDCNNQTVYETDNQVFLQFHHFRLQL